jgi:hypothetical protein
MFISKLLFGFVGDYVFNHPEEIVDTVGETIYACTEPIDNIVIGMDDVKHKITNATIDAEFYAKECIDNLDDVDYLKHNLSKAEADARKYVNEIKQDINNITDNVNKLRNPVYYKEKAVETITEKIKETDSYDEYYELMEELTTYFEKLNK